MLIVYFNYPRSRISVHHDPNCFCIQPMQKPDQRTIHINADNLKLVLSSLECKEVRFASKAELNDLWVFIDLDDNAEEENLLRYIQNVFSIFYKPLDDADIKVHC